MFVKMCLGKRLKKVRCLMFKEGRLNDEEWLNVSVYGLVVRSVR